MNISLERFVVSSTFGLLAFLLFACIGTAAERPNVILVMTDDQGYGDLACHGNGIIKTPNLDRLYKKSIRLTDFHVSPLCTPTRAALMTGQNPVRVGAWATTWGRSLPNAKATTMADLFAAAGYRTGCFGKWHLGDNYPYRPQDRGFGEVLVHGGGGVGQSPDFWGNDYFDDTYFRNGKPQKHKGYCTDVWFEAAQEFVAKESDKPFFAYLVTNAPHGPYLVDQKYSDLYKDNPDCPHANFYGMITNIDENMGRLVTMLEEKKLLDNTILIFMTDNGTAAGFRGGKGFNARMRGTKGSFYEGGHRVPCFFHWPAGGLVGGRDIDELTTHVDMIPTLADLCGLPIPKETQLEGVSLKPLLTGKEKSLPERNLFIQYRQDSQPPIKGNATVMRGSWRLVNGSELYDIKKDPGQKKNIAGAHPEVVLQLQRAYEQWWKEVSPVFKDFNHISLGDDAQNPTTLCSFDWHGPVAWNQSQVRAGAAINGFWAVNVASEGTYEISLRRWPVEANTPITAVAPEGKSKAVAATKARLKIGDFDQTLPVLHGAKAVTFKIQLPKGKAKLQTWLIDAKTGQSRGAYYVDVKRL